MTDGARLLSAKTTGAGAGVHGAVAALRQSMEEEGINPAGPMGVVLAGVGDALGQLATMCESVESGALGAVADVRKITEAEVEKLKQALVAAQVLLNQATTTKAILEVQRETLVSRMIGDIAPKIAVGVKEVLVIRERRVNRDLDWRRRMATAAVALALLLSGYVGRAIQDREATEALLRCGKAVVIEGATGQKYCRMDTLMPQ